MHDRSWLNKVKWDPKLADGSFFPSDLNIPSGARIALVRMGTGTPESERDVLETVQSKAHDPAFWPSLSGLPRALAAKVLTHWYRAPLKRAVERVGTGTSYRRLLQEQCSMIARLVNEALGDRAVVKPYVVMRHGSPHIERLNAELIADGITHILLMPVGTLHSVVGSGSALLLFSALQRRGALPNLPTAVLPDVGKTEGYRKALNERIDEGLQRFPRSQRHEVALLFVRHQDPIGIRYQHAESRQRLASLPAWIMEKRSKERTFDEAPINYFGYQDWIDLVPLAQLRELYKAGNRSALIVPVGMTVDHLESAYFLEILLKERADWLGYDRLEIAAPLNCHATFLETIASLVLKSLGQETPVGVAVKDAADMVVSS